MTFYHRKTAEGLAEGQREGQLPAAGPKEGQLPAEGPREGQLPAAGPVEGRRAGQQPAMGLAVGLMEGQQLVADPGEGRREGRQEERCLAEGGGDLPPRAVVPLAAAEARRLQTDWAELRLTSVAKKPREARQEGGHLVEGPREGRRAAVSLRPPQLQRTRRTTREEMFLPTP